MLPEFAVAFAIFAMLWVFGLPISMLLQSRHGARSPFAAMTPLAPAFGVAVLALVAGPAFMFIGPSEIWGWPMLLVLFGAAAWRLGAMRGCPRLSQSDMLSVGALALAMAVIALCLLAPALGGGFNRVVFNTNPSDTFMYLTLAESTRTATLEQIQGYAQNGAELVAQNPLGLYSARFVGVLMRLTTFIDLGWISQVSGIGVERLLWPFAFAMGMATASAAWSLARLMGVSALIASVAMIAVVVGFWGAMPREADAYSHLQSMPLFIAVVALRVIDAQHEKASYVLGAGVGILLAAFSQVYTELTVLVVGVLVAEAVTRAITTGKLKNAATALIVSLPVMIIVLFTTGQLNYIFDITIAQYTNVLSGNAPGSFSFEGETQTNMLATIAGFGWFSDFAERLGLPRWLIGVLTWLLAIPTLVAASLAGACTLWKQDDKVIQVVAAAAALGVAMALVAYLARGDAYIFQKAMTSAAPFSLMLIAALAGQQSLGRARAGAVVALLVAQLLFPAMAVARDLRGQWPDYAQGYHEGRNYNLEELNRRLDALCPCELLVNVPPEQDWWYAAYVALSVTRHHPYYQSGYMYDNGAKTVLVPGVVPMSSPRYAVVSFRDDYIGIRRLGELLYDAGQVRLYRITVSNNEDFAPRPISP